MKALVIASSLIFNRQTRFYILEIFESVVEPSEYSKKEITLFLELFTTLNHHVHDTSLVLESVSIVEITQNFIIYTFSMDVRNIIYFEENSTKTIKFATF